MTVQAWTLQSLWRPEERFGVIPSKGIQDVHVPESFPKTARHHFPESPGFPSFLTQPTCLPPRRSDSHPCISPPRPPFSPTQTSHTTAEEPASLWPYFTSGPLYNWQQKHLILFQSLHFSSILIYTLILEGRRGGGGGPSSFQAELILRWGWVSSKQLKSKVQEALV